MHRLMDDLRWRRRQRQAKHDGFQETANQVLSGYVQSLEDDLQLELDSRGHLMSLLDTWQRVKDTADQLDKYAPALAELDTFLYYHWVDLEVALNPKSPSELEFKKCQQARREILKRVTRFQDQMDKPKQNTQKLKRKEKLRPLPLPGDQYQRTQSSGEGENEGVPVPEEILALFPDDEPDQEKLDLR